jgi:hypothetical protein
LRAISGNAVEKPVEAVEKCGGTLSTSAGRVGLELGQARYEARSSRRDAMRRSIPTIVWAAAELEAARWNAALQKARELEEIDYATSMTQGRYRRFQIKRNIAEFGAGSFQRCGTRREPRPGLKQRIVRILVEGTGW